MLSVNRIERTSYVSVQLIKEVAQNNKNVVCRVKGNQLLVRFTEQCPMQCFKKRNTVNRREGYVQQGNDVIDGLALNLKYRGHFRLVLQ